MFARAVGSEQVTIAELGIEDTMAAVQVALDELAQARASATGKRT